ncbi:MAG: enoyl-CoA hydratase/isomerase family protein, partial [Sneathiella sp.]|nr:enoyl-CoA hydratase/isomerase family protein [Sneathiella sp.]
MTDHLNASTDDEILAERTEAICTLTLNRPQARNALTTHMADLLISQIEACQSDGTRVIILTGSAPAFCSGGDLNLIAELGKGN